MEKDVEKENKIEQYKAEYKKMKKQIENTDKKYQKLKDEFKYLSSENEQVRNALMEKDLEKKKEEEEDENKRNLKEMTRALLEKDDEVERLKKELALLRGQSDRQKEENKNLKEENKKMPVKAQPMDILLNCINVFRIFLCRICVVHTEVAESAEFLSHTEIYAKCFTMSDMKITVRLRWETCMYSLSFILTAL